MKKWKRLNPLLALALCAALMVTAVPQSAFISNAAEAYKVTASDEEAVLDSPVVSEGDAPVVSEGDAPTVSDGDAPVMDEPGDAPVIEDPTLEDPAMEEPAVSDGDFTLDPEEFQTKKLRIKPVKTTIYSGQSNVLAAKVIYESSTTDEGKGFTVTDISYQGQHLSSGIQWKSSEDNESLILDVSQTAIPGKYTIHLIPNVPNGIHAEPATLTVNIVGRIDHISIDGPEMVHKVPGKASTFQLTPTVKSFSADKPYNPRAFTWEVYYQISGEYVLYEGTDITISANGKVTLGKNLPSNLKQLYFKCIANDYPGTPVQSQLFYVYIDDFSPKQGTPIITSVVDGLTYYFCGNNAEVTAEALDGKYFSVTSYDNFNPGERIISYDGKCFTYKSNSKDVTVDRSGKISVLNVSGRPVTLTATSLDGKLKKTITLKLKKHSFGLDDLKLDVTVGLDDQIKTQIDKNSPNYSCTYSSIGNKPIFVDFTLGDKQDYLNMSVSVTGGKNITSNYYKYKNAMVSAGYDSLNAFERQRLVIIPTKAQVKITVKSGRNRRTYIIENSRFSDKKNVLSNKEPKTATSASLYMLKDSQQIKIYLGTQHSGKKVYIQPDAEYVLANYGNVMTARIFLDYLGESREVDDDGYIKLNFLNIKYDMANLKHQSSARKWIKIPNYFKFHLVLTGSFGEEDYTPIPFTIKVLNTEPKVNYKLKTKYNITQKDEGLEFNYYRWHNWDETNPEIESGYIWATNTYISHYYQELTYSNGQTLDDNIDFESFEADLGKDLIAGSELVNHMDIGRKVYGSYYLSMDDSAAFDLLSKKNADILASGKDVTKYGRDAKISGYLYVTYNLTTPEWYHIQKKDKVQVSITIPKSDYNRLKASVGK